MSDNPSFSVGFCLGSVVWIVILCIFFGWLLERSQRDIRQDAVDHRCADWVVDQRTGAVEFKWVTFPSHTIIPKEQP